jgi:hypothetical protein
MNCDWIFVQLDGTRHEATLPEPILPQSGNGKQFQGKGYVVRGLITGRTTSPNPMVFAEELPPVRGPN